jgi:hypothetical protein
LDLSCWYNLDIVDLSWLGSLTKAFANLFNAVTERIGNWLGRRKPHLYVHPNPIHLLWCIAHNGSVEIMQVILKAEFTHDDPKNTLVIMDAYPIGSHSQFKTFEKVRIPPHTIVDQQIVSMVLPVKGEKGKPWEARIEFVDQFQRKYRSKKLTFRRAGPPPDENVAIET